jgi:hypothetical protein
MIFCRRHVTAFADVHCLVIALPIFDNSCTALLISTTTALETIEQAAWQVDDHQSDF